MMEPWKDGWLDSWMDINLWACASQEMKCLCEQYTVGVQVIGQVDEWQITQGENERLSNMRNNLNNELSKGEME